MFCVPCENAIGEVRGTSIGATRAADAPSGDRPAHTCRTVHPSSFAYAKSIAETVLIVCAGTFSGSISACSASRASTHSFARASKPSTSADGSASA